MSHSQIDINNKQFVLSGLPHCFSSRQYIMLSLWGKLSTIEMMKNMFAKLRDCKIFKLLSGMICSIELVEVQGKVISSSHAPCLQSLHMKKVDTKSFTLVGKDVEAERVMSQFKETNI